MILADPREPATVLFPARVPEPTEAMTLAESEAFAAWQAGPAGQAFYRALARQVAAALGPHLSTDAPRVLSVGEGEGLLAAELARHRPGWRVVGLDVCRDVVARARTRPGLPENVRFVRGSVYELTRRWDAVISVSAFHHFHEPRRALEAMAGALEPQGTLYLLDLRRDAPASAYFRRLAQQMERDEWVKARLFRASVAASHTADELSDLLEGLGRAEVRALRLAPAALAALGGVGALSDVAPLLQDLHLEAWLTRGPRAAPSGPLCRTSRPEASLVATQAS
ncbi:MAG: trans-aconitate 2-methyltransferase [Planctomycetota bacterium]